jgi:hypothetical protein
MQVQMLMAVPVGWRKSQLRELVELSPDFRT